jgi:hypothetical protein
VIKEPQVEVHKADQPDVIGDFAHPDVLASEHSTQIDTLAAICGQ